MTAFPWISAGSLALTIALALIARKPREFDLSRFPTKVQQSGIAGIMFSSMFLFVFGAYVAWWSPAPIVGMGVALWLLASLLPRFMKLALEVVSVLCWPFSLIVAAFALTQFMERAGSASTGKM
jgi:hypothetical protein